MAAPTARPLAELVAEFVASTDLKASPSRDALVEKAKLHILDGIGVALAATTMEDQYAQKLIEVVRGFGSAPTCTMIGFPDRAAPPLAAFMNGSLIHGVEYDDRYLDRVVHTESFGVPVGLALAEERGLDGWALLEGWLLAAEVAIRLARGVNRDSLNGSGFHNTSIFGTLGAAAAAGRLIGFDADRIADAMSLSVSFASGTTQGWNDESGRNKCIQPGWAAMSGLMAAQMAEAGYACAHSTLDGPSGLYAAHAWKNGWTPDAVLENIGSTWPSLEIAFKIYPAGGSRHNVIDCTRQLVYEYDIKPEEVEHVDVIVASQYADMFEHGRYEQTFRPTSGYNMHGSWPINIARMILSRYIGVEHLTMEAVYDPALLAIADKVSCRPGDDLDYPRDERPTTVTITTTRGTFERTLRKSAGSADETDPERIVEKFRHNARLVLPEASVESLVKLIMSLDQLADAREITRLLAV
jgi:2-methylcitrate dehydratase PrpD